MKIIEDYNYLASMILSLNIALHKGLLNDKEIKFNTERIAEKAKELYNRHAKK